MDVAYVHRDGEKPLIAQRQRGFAKRGQELYADNGTSVVDPGTRTALLDQLGRVYPHIAEVARRASHDEASVIGPGCDDQFEFSLDLMLDGFERLHQRNWTLAQAAPAIGAAGLGRTKKGRAG